MLFAAAPILKESFGMNGEADDTHKPFGLFAGGGLGGEAPRFRCLETSVILRA